MSGLGKAWGLIKAKPLLFQVGKLRPRERQGVGLDYTVKQEQN